MSIPRIFVKTFLALAAAACLSLTALSVQSEAAVVKACVLKKKKDGRPKGSVRVVKSKKACKRGERFVTWNTPGPTGPTGARGPAGPSGPVGATGANGTDGADGATGA